MATNTPVSYLSSKCVFQYLDLNLRFRLSQRCPSLRSAERAAPLTINSLAFEPADFEINKTAYKISITRHYPKEETPIHISTGNSLGKVQFDVDQYGFPVLDNRIQRSREEVFFDNRQEEVDDLKRRCQADEVEWRQELDRLEENRLKYLDPQTPEFLGRKNTNLIISHKAMILPFDLCRNNMEPPFHHYLKITTTFDRRIKKTEYVMYNRSIYEAMKYLIWKFFAGRHIAVQVDTLRINFLGVLRFPMELKLKVKKLKIESSGIKYLDSIMSTLHPESFPLESVEIDGYPPFKHPIIQGAQKLILPNGLESFMFEALSHRRVHVSSNTRSNIILKLVKHWFRTGREIGTCYSFGGYQLKVEQALEKVRRNIHLHIDEIEVIRGRKYPLCVVVPMQNNLSEINIYCVKRDYGVWNMMVKVQPRGFAGLFNV